MKLDKNTMLVGTIPYNYDSRFNLQITKRKMKYNELEALVIAWAQQKGIFEKGNPEAQCDKTFEEVTELSAAIYKNNKEEIISFQVKKKLKQTHKFQTEMISLKLMESL
jgi:hypothetical protein